MSDTRLETLDDLVRRLVREELRRFIDEPEPEPSTRTYTVDQIILAITSFWDRCYKEEHGTVAPMGYDSLMKIIKYLPPVQSTYPRVQRPDEIKKTPVRKLHVSRAVLRKLMEKEGDEMISAGGMELHIFSDE
jgi:hypothetical protein